jgi:hypothetical protein
MALDGFNMLHARERYPKYTRNPVSLKMIVPENFP